MLTDCILFYRLGYKECPMGQPGALQPAARVCQHLRQLVWLHASGPLSVSPGPRALQRSSVCPAQEVQRPGESVNVDGQKGWVAWRSGLVAFWTVKWTKHWWTVKMGQSRLHVDKAAVWSICEKDIIQSSDRPWRTVLDLYILI